MASNQDSTTGVMLTLAALTAIGAVERHATESLDEQSQRISDGIRELLARKDLLSYGWQLEWLGLTADRANLTFVASDTTSPGSFAVSLRGTVFSLRLDIWEDADVWTAVDFALGGKVAQGTSDAYYASIAAECVVDDLPGAGMTLVPFLTELVGQVDAPKLYVTGHSLGGGLATVAGLALAARVEPAEVLPYTFAAPTAGDADFAAAFDAKFPDAVCVWNSYDAVPHAWQTLDAIGSFFPKSPPPESKQGPKPTTADRLALAALAELPWNEKYVQPKQRPPLNLDYKLHGTSDVFVDEIAFQHMTDTYLTLLGAPTIGWPAPDVAWVDPRYGSGGDPVEIHATTGTTFTPDCLVDFSAVRATDVKVSADGQTITATAPGEWPGLAQIYVTNMYGQSEPALFFYDW